MNQILISEKLYVTPELKRKRKMFKIEFFLSVFLLCAVSSYGIYAEYDRNKSAEVSKEMLDNISFHEIRKRTEIEETIVVIVNSDQAMTVTRATEVEVELPKEQKIIGSDGLEYYTVGIINIPAIDLEYPILTETTAESLKVAPGKFWGPDPNEVGNFCIAGHNYTHSRIYNNTIFFSKVPTLENGDYIYITDLTGRTIAYEVYDKYIVDPTDVSCTSQLTDGRREVTLITCTRGAKERVIVKAVEVIY